MSDAHIPSDHQFKSKWRWPEDVEETVTELMSGYSLNICCGLSPLGDVRVDASKDPAGMLDEDSDDFDQEDLNNALASDAVAVQPTMAADMKNLPFDDCSFDTVIFDPPWKMAYFDRYKPFYEAVRVCKKGGRIIVNAKWPCESELTEIISPFDSQGDDEVMIVRADNPWRDASIITVHEKVAREDENESLDAFQGTETDAVPTRPRPNQWQECYGCKDEMPRDELEYTSEHAPDMERFCSPECMHEFEDWLGVELTPVDPDEMDSCNVHPTIVAEWRREGQV